MKLSLDVDGPGPTLHLVLDLPAVPREGELMVIGTFRIEVERVVHSLQPDKAGALWVTGRWERDQEHFDAYGLREILDGHPSVVEMTLDYSL